jgi:hypothetical protein
VATNPSCSPKSLFLLFLFYYFYYSYLCRGSGFIKSGSSISSQSGSGFRIQSFDDQKFKKKQLKKLSFLIKSGNFLIPLPSAVKIKHPALQKIKFIVFFVDLFALLDPDPDCESEIRIHNTDSNVI